ncbi:MAG: TolC family protein [Pedobacter sp.]|nr:MAG: TolC family protein [Pedobacter sp.]
MGCLLIGFISVSVAQDTLKLSLRETEKMFLTENYQLIAQQYETDQASAEIITAKLFDNPELSFENLFYNHETRKFLETSMATGQYSASIAQLVKLAGKRNKNIQLARTGLKLAEYAYFDLMRTLRFELRSTYYKAYYAQQSALVYEQQIRSLGQLLEASEKQLSLGNIAAKDIIRIQSLVYGLKAEHNTLMNELEDLKSKLRQMTNISAEQELAFKADGLQPELFQIDNAPYSLLLDSARANRPDLQLAKTEVTYAQQQLSVQKAMAIPDVEISLSYDLKGNYPEKYTGLGISIPIPLFNRNQGEIKKARIAVDARNTGLKMQEAALENELFSSYKTALKKESLFKSLDQNFSKNFDELMTAVTRNFKERNISLIEFLDFYDAYKENTIQLNNLRYELMNAKEGINYVTGSTIFK